MHYVHALCTIIYLYIFVALGTSEGPIDGYMYELCAISERRCDAVVVQEGSMRCDVNVSVRPTGQQKLGTKVEVKNMNSFSAMQKAIDFEIDRQVCLLPCQLATCLLG